MARSIVAAAWCGVAALALAGCGGADGGGATTIAGSLEIRAVSAEASAFDLPADVDCAQAPPAPNESGWVCDGATVQAYLVEPASLAADDVATVSARPTDLGRSAPWEVGLTFTATGAKKFEELTREASEAMPPANKVVIVVDGEVVTAPSVSAPIAGGEVVISGNSDKVKAEALEAAIAGTSGTQ